MIKRDKYLKQLIDSKDNGFPKVITGLRRSGKSFLLKELYRDYLKNSGVPVDDIIILELDDDRNIEYRDPILLGDHIRNLCSNKNRCYVFIDEIQKVYTIKNPVLTGGRHILATTKDTETVSFVDVVLGLSREENIDLYITGSNSKMLSTDIITEFRDKAVNIYLSPLSFDEYYGYVGGSEYEALYQYMQYGGMPLSVLKNDDQKKDYLQNLFQTTYFSDIIERHKLRRGGALDELSNIVSTLTGEMLNSEKIANTFKTVRHESIDKQTVESYISYFEDAFLIREAKRYDLKGRKEIGALKKYYYTDTGLRNARLNFVFPDEGQILETIVFNELCYNGYTVNIGVFDTIEKDKNGKSIRKSNEIDFYARKGLREYYIQVCLDISDTKTKERELRPLLLMKDQIQKVLVINKPIKESRDENGFIVIGICDFLLRFINDP